MDNRVLKMEVKLITWTPWPEYVCYIASRTCRSSSGPIEMLGWVQTPEMITSHIKARLDDGHYSIFEHANFTFGIEGISRTCLAQLTRHRIASFSVQSQRVVEPSEYVTPESMKDSNLVKRGLLEMSSIYDTLISDGVPREDARFILPQAATTNLVTTMNARELLHFFKLRLHKSSQWEIRKLARHMLDEVRPKAPVIFSRVDSGE